MRFPRFFASAFILLAAVQPLSAEPALLGNIDFPNSGAAEAQDDFVEGVLYLHNFEYRDAAEAFKRAQEIDPDFAMAYWGEALTYNHPLWRQQARQEALESLRRLGRTPEERQEKAPTKREKDYLRAIEILYGTVSPAKEQPKDHRDRLYMEAMRRLHETYPNDHEAATFYGLSILGNVHDGRDYAAYMRAAAELTSVWDANREHPGAAHYLIHSYDDPVHAPLGLPMARAYSKIAPEAAHAQHMTSHIFVALGMWDDLVTANEIADRMENENLVARGERPIAAGHYVAWLQYGYLQQGRFKDAAKIMAGATERMKDNPKQSSRGYYTDMLARYVLDTTDWEALDEYDAAVEGEEGFDVDHHFIRAYCAVQRGNLKEAETHLEKIRGEKSNGDPRRSEERAAILRSEIEALLLLERGKSEKGLERLREAVAAERELSYMFGPPAILKPTAELLGEALYELGEYEAALEAFREQLTRTPGRTLTLLGLARAAQAAGDVALADETYGALAAIWHSADSDLPWLDEVRKASGG